MMASQQLSCQHAQRACSFCAAYLIADLTTLAVSEKSNGGHLNDWAGKPLVQDIYEKLNY